MPIAAAIPKLAVALLPLLNTEINNQWPDIYNRSYLAGQIEQETCVTLKSASCWNPKAQLFTYEDLISGKRREYGFGLGQITITKKFNNFEAATKLDPSMKNWKFDDRFNAVYQLRFIVITDRNLYSSLRLYAPDPYQRMAFMFAGYNGGRGGLIQDRTLCRNTKNCDPEKWWGNVEKTSLKSRTAVAGYGKSFFDINREYPRNIVFVRSAKYAPYLDNEK